ncbi:unnamed protein product [Penicillium salamii]|uniref:Yeast cell wall synthesis Kre9/Knh1-like N-terminal domain-containing protein n=1 Tax=Penicillium salamii TaxID=1612424 RepID=A0A9W4IUB9_9EURO|nr:unnamed protein product [Penicillium salamii]CAG8143059.1 unnamed protein product [Penicillium salamii]CAG8279349.1 unnamed protein product [Penicillium salamii]CAG8296579.1 unnamed protein product [Penicillium salamii]CAG8347402.1 unnamed protein product [Penicillium salamii]
MYFSPAFIAVSASLITLGLADPLSFNSWPKEPLQPGKPITLTWSGADPSVPVTLLLREGSSTKLKDVKAITDQGKDGTFTWTPDNDIKPDQTYAFQIKQGEQVNYTALLKSSDKPLADLDDENTTTGTTATRTTGTSTQTTGTTMTTSSKALISSSASASGSPSSSAAATTTTTSSEPTGTEVVNGKEPDSTGAVQTGAASIPQYSAQLAMGVVGLLAYLV